MAKGKKRRQRNRISPFVAGMTFIVVAVLVTYFGFTKSNPFANPYQFEAVFSSANNLAQSSPVRVAGVNVGKVKKVEPMPDGSGAARVTMEMKEEGLPLHTDAELKIRPRIFLEGNFFVDVQPGSPTAPELPDGDTIPINQTAYPVQFGQVLTALQQDTRENLKIFLAEYSKGLEGEGGAAFNRSIQYWEDAYRNTAQANTALLGTEEGDLFRLMKGQATTFGALARNEEALKDLITNFETTAGALAREDDALRRAIPALDNVLRVGNPALRTLNGALPSLRSFARDALPGTRSSVATIDATLPFLRQARGLVSETELRGLTRDLRPTIPALARANRLTIPLLRENRALSSCQNSVLLPFAKTPIPDPSFPSNNNQPFFKQAPRGLVGLSGESRSGDANGQFFRVNFGGGPTSVASGEGPSTVFGTALFPPLGARPARNTRPQFRPDVACETQEPPNLEAPAGEAMRVVTPSATPLPNLPLPVRKQRVKSQELLKKQTEQVVEHLKRVERGEPSVDPFEFSPEGIRLQERKLGIDRKKAERR